MKPSTWKAALALLGVFLLGALAGSAGGFTFARKSGPPPPRGGHVQHLQRELDLTADQREQIRAIFDAHRAKMDQLKAEVFEGCGKPLREEVEAVDEKIRAVLNPDQRTKFDALVEERRKRGFRGPPGRPRGGHGRHGGPPPPPVQ